MGRRFTVMGFTEAELGFALAAFFVAVGAGYLNERNQLDDRQGSIKAEADSLRSALDSVRSGLDSVRSSLDSLRTAHTELQGTIGKRSNLTPPCSEKGESDRPIARLTILVSGTYDLEGRTLSFADVAKRLEGTIAKSRRLGCRYTVQVTAADGVDARTFSRANGRLRGLFYVRER